LEVLSHEKFGFLSLLIQFLDSGTKLLKEGKVSSSEFQFLEDSDSFFSGTEQVSKNGFLVKVEGMLKLGLPTFDDGLESCQFVLFQNSQTSLASLFVLSSELISNSGTEEAFHLTHSTESLWMKCARLTWKSGIKRLNEVGLVSSWKLLQASGIHELSKWIGVGVLLGC